MIHLKIKNLARIIHSFKRKSGNVIIVCPRCGSPNIHLSSNLDAWLTPERYVCWNCGYEGPLVLELEIKKEDRSTS